MGGVSSSCRTNCGDTEATEQCHVDQQDIVGNGTDKDEVLSEAASADDAPVYGYEDGASLMDVRHFSPALANHMMAHMWPSAQQVFNDILLSKIEPAVQKKLGSYGKLFHFDQDNCQLGNLPLTMKSQCVHQTVQETTDGKLTNLVVRNDIDWKNSEMNIQLKFDHLRVKVNFLHVRCTGIIELVGMRGHPPFFDGCRAFVINPPHVDLELEMSKFNAVLHIGFIKRTMVDAIVETISKIVVVPHRIPVWHAKGTDRFRIFHPRPKGVMSIWLVRLDGFQAARSTDPYVTVRCGAMHEKMHVPHGEKGEEQRIDIPIYMPSHQVVHFQIRRKQFTKDDFLGDAQATVEEMISWGGDDEQSVELSHDPECDLLDGVSASKRDLTHIQGSLCLRAEWRPLHLNLEEDTRGAGLLFVGVHFISHLPVGEQGSTVCVELNCSQTSPHAPHMHGKLRTKWKGQEDSKGKKHEKAEAQTLIRKVEICHKRKMSVEDMVEVLEVDKPRIVRILEGVKKKERDIEVSGIAGRHAISFDEAFEFLLIQPDDAVLDIQVRRKKPFSLKGSFTSSLHKLSENLPWHQRDSDEEHKEQGDDKDHDILGSTQFHVKDLLGKQTDELDLNLPQTDAIISLRTQIRMLGQPCKTRY